VPADQQRRAAAAVDPREDAAFEVEFGEGADEHVAGQPPLELGAGALGDLQQGPVGPAHAAAGRPRAEAVAYSIENRRVQPIVLETVVEGIAAAS
jgi:hypothetical protein